LKTSVWNTAYLASIPLLLVQFAAFFGFSALLATMFRSTVVCVIGVIGCWLICMAINYSHHSLVAAPILQKQDDARREELKAKLLDEAVKNAKPRPDPLKVPKLDSEGKVKQEMKTPQSAAELLPNERPDLPAATRAPSVSALSSVVGLTYWILPKPLDFGYVIYRNIDAEGLVEAPTHYDVMVGGGLIDLRWSIATSVLFACFMLFAAVQQFQSADY